MRLAATAATVSWIPTESLKGALRSGLDLQVSHFDVALPEDAALPKGVHKLFEDDQFRFANVLSVTAEFDDDGRCTEASYADDSRVVMGSTTTHVGKVGATFRALALPTLRREPQRGDGEVRFTQTAGGRTSLPVPRPVPHPPYLRWQSPVVWTTLELVLRADGTREVELSAASGFPNKHWVYDDETGLRLQSGLGDKARWVSKTFGVRHPWTDREQQTRDAEAALGRDLAADLLRDGADLEVRQLEQGATLTRQGDAGEELFLVLDGVVDVDVDGKSVAELGPGAVIGERALLDGGSRQASVTARTPLRVAVATKDALDLDRLRVFVESQDQVEG